MRKLLHNSFFVNFVLFVVNSVFLFSVLSVSSVVNSSVLS